MTRLQTLKILTSLNDYDQHIFPFKTVAFVKVVINGTDKMFSFVIDKNQDLQAFIDRLIEPKFHKPGQSISAYNYKFTAFHKKRKGSTIFTMAENPDYLVSHSLRKNGFFVKPKLRKV